MKRKEAEALTFLVIIGVIIAPFILLYESLGGWGCIFLALSVLGLYVWFNHKRQQKRKLQLMEKYGDEEIVQLIMQQSFWLGQSEVQLIDSIGKPNDIDQKVLKTKTKETWKYYHQGANRYGLRVTLENGAVIGWDKKS